EAEIEIRDPYTGVGAQARTDDAGRYLVSGLPPNTVVVRVLPVEHAPVVAEVTGLVAGATLAWNAVVQPGATVFGEVTAPGGATVAGATILVAPADGSPGRSGRSAEDGSYEIRGLAPGTYRLEVFCKGHGASVVTGVVVPAGGSVERDLALSAPGTLQGHVLDGVSGLPIAGAEIAVSSSGALEPVLSDAAGAFVVGSLPPGPVTLLVSAEGYLPDTQVVTIGAKESIEVRLDRPWSLAGKVLAGVEPVAGLGLYLEHSSGGNVNATTAEDGTFLIEGLRGGDWILVASGPVGEILIHDSFSLTPVDKDVWKDYAVARGEVRGRIVTADGAPLKDAEIRLARGGSIMAETTSDDDGAFVFGMVPGVYDVSAVHRDFGAAKRLSLPVGSGAVIDLGDWSPAGVGLTVTATDGAAPLAGAVAELVWLNGLGGERLIAHGDEAGHMAFGHLAPGTYRLNTSAPGRARLAQNVVIAGTDSAVAAALAVEGVVAGRVRTASGAPVPFALVWASDLTDGETLLTLADAAGDYRLEGLPARPVSVWVTDHVLTPATFGVTPTPGVVTTVDVVLPANGAYVLAHLVNPLGQSVGGVRCTAVTPTGIEVRSTATGTDGIVVLGPLPDGDFTVVFTIPGLLPVMAAVTISGADVDLGDVLLDEVPGTGGFGGGGKWSIWDWVHGQNPPKRYIKDTPGWRALHQDYWNAYVASGKDCPDAPEAYRQASLSSQSINTRFDAWCLTYAAMSGMTGAELNTLAAEIGILTGKISMQIAGLSGAMEAMKGPAFLAKISPDMPAELVKGYNDLSFAIDFVIDSTTRLVACLNSGEIDASEVAFDQMIATVQAMVGAVETVAKIIEKAGSAGSTSTFLAGGALGKTLGVLGTIKDLYGYWKGLKEKEKNIIETIKANERANEMYNDMLQRHMGNLSRLAAAIGCDDDDDPPPPPPPPPPPWPPPPPGGFPEGGNGPSAVVGRVLSRDPNEKESLGVGAANWVPAGREVTYIIHFENEDDATAPAQTVTITDVLPADLEVGTFEALQVSFNGTTVDLPAGTRDYLGSTTVASDPNPVRLRVHLNETTRTVEWVMQSYDPATGELPVDALAGFLPPNDDTGRGEGFVMFRIRPRDGLPTGSGIRNVARIVFDENEAIMTNQIDPHDPSKGTSPDKEALATIDVEAPASRVDDLPAVSPPAIEVSWSGWDDLGGVEGSGASTWTIYVQEDGGAFAPWLVDTPLTGAVYNGVAGRTYGFYSVATDAVGWSEPGKAAAEATTIAGYTVRLEAEANGALADGPVLQIVAPGGSTVPVRAVPAAGYHLEGWWLDGQPIGTANPITLDALDRDRTLTARFAINQYVLTYLAQNGTIGGGAAVQVANHGSDGAEVTAQPAEGFHFTTWSDGVQTPTRRDLAVTAPLTVTAICEINIYPVTFLAGAHGTLAGGPNEVTILVAHGSLCPDAPAIVAEATWVHAGWSPALPAVITGPAQTTAQYVRQAFTLTYLLGANGLAVGPSPQTVIADEDGEPVLAVPAEGSHFVGWSDGEDDNPRTDRDVQGNLTVTALFEVNTYPVTFLAGAHGTLAGGPNEVTTMVAHGSPCPQPPAVTADATWGFTGWSPALPAVITGPVVTTAQYVRLNVTLTYLLGANGLAVGPSPQTVLPGEDGLPVLAVAAEGYRFAGWSDGKDDNPRTDEEVQNDLTVTAWFVPNNPLPPNGAFVALVGADSLGGQGRIWNLGGAYTMNLGNATLTLRLSHDSQGRLVGNGALQPHAPAAGGVGIPVVIRGTVRGRDGAVVAQLSLTGQRTGLPGQPLARASASGSLNLALDPSPRTLNGRAQISVILGTERLAISSARVTPLPAPMDGSFRLDLQLDLDGTAVDGAATLTLANGVAYNLIANGVYNDPVSDLTLTPDPSDPAAQGIRLRLVVLTREDRSAVVQSLSGGLGGQILGGDL
ncbi:MAG: hypothetical protein GX595_07995, partial [Lentisphaerae bacterium]|nr:hypothetical protein [Lentisphaerota bacterium]